MLWYEGELVPGCVWWTQLTCAYYHDVDVDAELSLVQNARCPANILTHYASSDDVDVRGWVAEHPACPLAIIDQLAQDSDETVRMSVSGRHDLAEHTMLLLASDPDESVIEELSRNSHITLAVCEALHARGDSAPLAGNPATPQDTLRSIANGPADNLGDSRRRDLRYAVACNPHCPADLLEALGNDPGALTKEAVAANPATPLWLLETWSHDPSRYPGLAKNSSIPDQRLWDIADSAMLYNQRDTLASIVLNPHCPEDLIGKILDREPDLAVVVARRTTLSGALMNALYQIRGDGLLADDLARRPTCPRPLIDNLLASGQSQKIRAALTNPNISFDDLLGLPVAILAGSLLNTDLLDDLPADTAGRMIGLGSSWGGTLGELYHAVGLLGTGTA